VDSIPVPLWSIGVILIVVGPFAVQRLVDLWTKPVEQRTDEALSAMTARSPNADLTKVRDRDDDTADEDA
jgi:hypothetical protein